MPKTNSTPTRDKPGIKSTPVVTPVAAYRQLVGKGPVQSKLTQLFKFKRIDKTLTRLHKYKPDEDSQSENESSVSSAGEPNKKGSFQREFAAYRQWVNRGPVQATLTQSYKHERDDESHSENESSISSAVEPKKKRSVQKEAKTPLSKQVSTTETKRFSSKDPAYNGDKTKPQPGDIIMSTVEKIQHPLLELGIVKKNFVMFGIVRSFSYHNRDNGNTKGYARDHERLEVCWCNLIKDGHRYIDKRTISPPVTINSQLYIDHRMYPKAVRKDDVTLLAKGNDPDLSGLNPFIATEVERVYYFASPGGWSTKV